MAVSSKACAKRAFVATSYSATWTAFAVALVLANGGSLSDVPVSGVARRASCRLMAMMAFKR